MAAIGRGEGDALVECAEALRRDGFAVEDVSWDRRRTAMRPGAFPA
jgi:hypothetical protein